VYKRQILIRHLGKTLKNVKLFYPDFPYSGKLDSIEDLQLPIDAYETRFVLESQEIELWKKAAGSYHSQISSFWKSPEVLYKAIDKYASSRIGCALWTLPETA
jgi:hypothetical protein